MTWRDEDKGKGKKLVQVNKANGKLKQIE